MNIMEKLLFIDDKKIDGVCTGHKLMASLDADQRELVVFIHSTEDYFRKSGEKFKLRRPKRYKFVFVHDSFDEPMLESGDIKNLEEQLAGKLIYFSGTKKDDIKKRTLCRESLYERFKGFLDISIKVGSYKIDALFRNNYRCWYARDLLNAIRFHSGELVEKAISTSEFQDLYKIKNYNPAQFERIKNNFRSNNYEHLDKALDDLVDEICGTR